MTIKPFISLANFDEANLGADSELRRFKNDVSSFELLGLAPASIPYYQSVFTQFNAKLNCIPNEIQPTQNQCTLSPSTQAGDLKSTRNTSDYCLTLNRADFTEITGRYDAATCMDGSPPLTTLVGSIEQAFASAKSSWDSGRALTQQIYTKVGQIETDLASIVTEYQSAPLANSIESPLESLSIRKILPLHPHPDIVKGKEYESLTECGQVTERLARDLLGNFCFAFVQPFSTHSIWLSVLSVCMTLFGFCAYLSVMQIDLKGQREIKHGSYSQATVMPSQVDSILQEVRSSHNVEKPSKAEKGTTQSSQQNSKLKDLLKNDEDMLEEEGQNLFKLSRKKSQKDEEETQKNFDHSKRPKEDRLNDSGFNFEEQDGQAANQGEKLPPIKQRKGRHLSLINKPGD